jgi:hypothetical protein
MEGPYLLCRYYSFVLWALDIYLFLVDSSSLD